MELKLQIDDECTVRTDTSTQHAACDVFFRQIMSHQLYIMSRRVEHSRVAAALSSRIAHYGMRLLTA